MKYLSITEAVADPNPSLWVVNTSSRVQEIGGDVFITIPTKGNTAHVLTIQKTWLPDLVTNRFPKQTILESIYFTEAVNQGNVSIISEEDALKLTRSPEAAIEKKRLAASENMIKEATAARGIGKNVMISVGDEDEDDLKEKADENKNKKKAFVSMKNLEDDDEGDAEDKEPEKVSASFRGWVVKLNRYNEGDEALVTNDIRVRGEMSYEEAEYLSENIKFPTIAAKILKSIEKSNN